MFSQKIWQAQLDKVSQYHAEIQRNLMIQFRENNPTESRMEQWTDRQTIFHGTLPATARGLTNTTAVDWHLKVKDMESTISV